MQNTGEVSRYGRQVRQVRNTADNFGTRRTSAEHGGQVRDTAADRFCNVSHDFEALVLGEKLLWNVLVGVA